MSARFTTITGADWSHASLPKPCKCSMPNRTA
jgi:hypothetical protein